MSVANSNQFCLCCSNQLNKVASFFVLNLVDSDGKFKAQVKVEGQTCETTFFVSPQISGSILNNKALKALNILPQEFPRPTVNSVGKIKPVTMGKPARDLDTPTRAETGSGQPQQKGKRATKEFADVFEQKGQKLKTMKGSSMKINPRNEAKVKKELADKSADLVYYRGARDLPQLHVGDRVRVQDQLTKAWSSIGTLLAKSGPKGRHCKIKIEESGAIWWRNRAHVHLAPADQEQHARRQQEHARLHQEQQRESGDPRRSERARKAPKRYPEEDFY